MVKRMVGKKQSSNNEDWLRLYDQCMNLYSKDELDELADKTVDRFKKMLVAHRIDINRIGFCWSGGKDSLVMYDVLKRAGIPMRGGVVILHQNEYPSFERWLRLHAPQEATFRRSQDLTLEFINEHPDYLFPVDAKPQQAYTGDWLKELKRWFDEQELQVVVNGHRIIDGNICHKDEYGFHYMTRKDGLVKYSIIADWSHEQVLAYIRHHDLELPHPYFWPNGFRFGTHQWTERRRLNGSYYDTLDELMQLEPSVVYNAADKLDIVRKYLEERK